MSEEHERMAEQHNQEAQNSATMLAWVMVSSVVTYALIGAIIAFLWWVHG